MHLTPKLPPGRASRKALEFSPEIHRLRSAGYSIEAIRLALRDAGVNVSPTTVRREVAKSPAMAPAVPQGRDPQLAVPQPPSSTPVLSVARPAVGASSPARTFLGDARTGHEIAEEFMKDRICNPLIRERMEDEARRD